MRSLNDLIVTSFLDYTELVGAWITMPDAGFLSGIFLVVDDTVAAGTSEITLEIRGNQVGPTLEIDSSVLPGDSIFNTSAPRNQEREVSMGETVHVTCNGGAGQGNENALLHITLILTR